MKTPVYAALDLHSAYSVLGSMDHGGKTQPRTRFATQAESLQREVTRLRQRKRPVLFDHGSRGVNPMGQWDRATTGGAADHL